MITDRDDKQVGTSGASAPKDWPPRELPMPKYEFQNPPFASVSSTFPATRPSALREEAVKHLRECVKLVPPPGAIEAAERFLSTITGDDHG